jgi:uncharacterized repeat protein (TIGR01451 family)
VATGHGPNAIAITPDGRNAYVPSVADRTISWYRINPATGKLTVKSLAAAVTGRGSQAIAITPDGRSAYVANENDGTISQYTIAPATGKITPKAPAAVHAASGSEAVAVTPDANVSVKMTAPHSVTSAARVTYTITVAGSGPSRAWQTALTDHLPGRSRFVKASAAGGHCTGPRPGTRGATVRCALGKIGTGQARRIRIIVTAPARHTVLRNAVTAASATPDPVRADNTATARTTVRS